MSVFILLLFNGSAFFANMASVFDQAYHVESRNFLMQRVVSILMLIVVTTLVIVSTLALGLGAMVDNAALALPVGPVLAKVISWSVSIVSAILLFVLLYKVLPNGRARLAQCAAGHAAGGGAVLPDPAAVPDLRGLVPTQPGVRRLWRVLVFTFFLYLLGFVFVIGAELNAFLQEPARSAALAEATKKAHQGQAQFDESGGEVTAEATGDAPPVRGSGPLGAPARSARAQVNEQGGDTQPEQPGQSRQPQRAGGSFAGRLLGFIGLLVAVMMLRNQKESAA